MVATDLSLEVFLAHNRGRRYYFHPKRGRKKKHRPGHRPPHHPSAPLPVQVFQDAEPSIIAGLVRRGATVKLSPELDNTFKIDGLIEKIDRGPSNPLPIGLQITQSIGRFEKIRTFTVEAAKWPGIGPLLYAEIYGQISRAMLTALRNALLSLWNEPFRRKRKAWRVTVYTSGDIEWYPI